MENNLRLSSLEEEVSIIDYLKVIAKYKNLIISLSFFATILSVVISLSMPKIYEASTTFLPPLKGQEGLLTKLISQSSLGGVSSLMGEGGTKGYFLPILKSRNIRERIVKRYQLIKFFKLDDQEGALKIGEAIEVLKGITTITQEKEGSIVVKVQLKSPRLAADIANAYVFELQNYINNSSLSVERNNRLFIKGQLDSALESLKRAENSFKAFQEEHQAISLDIQVEETIKKAAELKAQVMLIEVQLGVMKSYVSPTHPEFEKKELEIKEIKKQLAKIEAGQGNPDPNKDLSRSSLSIIPLQEVPKVSLELLRLKRSLVIQEMIYKLLLEEYEKAKISEAKEAIKIEVLDKATPSFKKIKPKIILNVLLAGTTSLFIGIFLAFFLEYLERQGINIYKVFYGSKKEKDEISKDSLK
ncbi:hypothetical protein KKB84_09450 [bacterium]|nr:hypothetical protein [bacterium]